MINENLPGHLPNQGSSPPPQIQAKPFQEIVKQAQSLSKLRSVPQKTSKKWSPKLKKSESKAAPTESSRSPTLFQQLPPLSSAEPPHIPRTFSASSFPQHHTSVAKVANRTLSFIENRKSQLAETLKQAQWMHLTPEEREVVSAFLAHNEQADALVENLITPTKREQGLQMLQSALLHALLTASVKESQVLMNVYRTLFPVPEEKGESLIELKNIALVLGDAFIHDSGYEGGISSRPYADLILDMLNTTSTSYPQAEALKYMLKNHFNLRENIPWVSLQESIKKTLSACPENTQRCLLSGGWSEHAIEYEIEKKANGRYAFRVYNEGQGITYHEHINANHKTKYAGCIALDEIYEECLFQPAFLGGLQALCSVDGDRAPKILVTKLLPLLGGQEEAIAPELQHYLSPQRSGVCTYRSLQAFIAHTLPAEQYKKFKFEYKLFLLEKFLPLLESKAKKKIKNTDYWNTVREFALLKRCIEKFAHSIANLSSSLDQTALETAHVTTRKYNYFLDKLERRLLACEKNSSLPLPDHSDQPQVFFAPKEPLKIDDPQPTSAIASVQLPETKAALVDAIQKIPMPGQEPAFSQAIEQCLSSFTAWTMSPGERWQLMDLLLKKIGSFEAISRVNFSQPKDTLSCLHTLLCNLISAAHAQELDKLCIYYSCYALYERAFRLLPGSTRVFHSDFPSFLKTIDLAKLKAATCCDPFWISRFDELQSLLKSQTTANSSFLVPDIYKKEYGGYGSNHFVLDANMSREIMAWWSDAQRPWNTEVPHAQSLKTEYAQKHQELSSKKIKLEEELGQLQHRLADSHEVLEQGDSLKKSALLKLEIAKKHSEISQFLLSQCSQEESSLQADEDFMRAWNALDDTTQPLMMPGMPGYDQYQEQRRAKDKQKVDLILSKLSQKAQGSASSIEDQPFIQIYKRKVAELDQLLEEQNNTPSSRLLESLEQQIFKKKYETDLIELEMHHLELHQVAKLTPYQISLSQDRWEQQVKTKHSLFELQFLSFKQTLGKKYGDLEIQLMQQLQELYKDEIEHPFISQQDIISKLAQLAHTPILKYLTDFVKSQITEHYNKAAFGMPIGLSECEKQLAMLIDNMKNTNQEHADANALAINQLECRPNEHDYEDTYWPYGWETGAFSQQDMATYLFGRLPKLLQDKLNADTEIIPKEFKQFYHHATLAHHYSGQKVEDVDQLLKMEGIQQKEPGSSTVKQKIELQEGYFPLPKPETFNQYAQLENKLRIFFSAFKNPPPEEAVHEQLGLLYSQSDPRGIPLSSEAYIDLVSLHQPNIQIEATLSYFVEHADLLSKPEWIEALHFLLFEKNLLLQELQDPSVNVRTMTKLDEFFKHLTAQAEHLVDFSLMGNLLWTKSLVQSYIDHANLTLEARHQPRLPSLFTPKDISENMKKTLQSPLNNDNLRIFFEGLTAGAYRFDLSTCSREELGYILLANLMRNLLPVSNDPLALRSRQVEKTEFNIHTLFTQHPHIKASEFFLPIHRQILKNIYTNIGELNQDPSQPDALVNRDKSLRICFSAGRIQSSNEVLLHRYEIPLKPSQKDAFKQCGLFTEENDLSLLRCCYHSNDVYIKKLPDGPLFTLRKSSDSTHEVPYMHITLPDGTTAWGEWIPEKEAQWALLFRKSLAINGLTIINDGLAAANHSFVIASGTKHQKIRKDNTESFELGEIVPDTNFILCDKKNLKPCYMTVEHAKPKELQRRRQSGLLVDRKLIDLRTGQQLVSPSDSFKQFEEFDQTCYWADDNHTIQTIDFPRYHLTFRKQKSRFICEQFPGWHLDKEQYAPHLNPSTGFIRLQRKDKTSKKTLTKVLIPLLEAKEETKNTEGKTERALNFPYTYDFQAYRKTTALNFCEYDLIDKILVPKTLEARYHLAKIYMQKGYQDDAEDLLFDQAAEITSRPLTPQERSALKKIVYKSPSTEVSSRMLRMKMHALYLLTRDELTAGSRNESHLTTEAMMMHKKKQTLIQDYLSQLHHIKRLEAREESLLIPSASLNLDSTHVPIQQPKPISLNPRAADIKDIPETLLKASPEWTQEPNFREKILYLYERKAGAFPFDFTDPIAQRHEFPKYIPLIRAECRKVTDLKSARDNGLIPLLFYLATFGGSEKTQDYARMLLKEIPKLNPIPATPAEKPHLHEVKKKAQPMLKEALHSLNLLKEIAASKQADTYLPEMCSRFLHKHPSPTISPHYFDVNNSKTQGDPGVRAEFQALNENIENASHQLQTESQYVLSHDNLEQLFDEIEEAHEIQKQAQHSQEKFILQNITSALLADPVTGMLITAKKRPLPSIEELCLLCSRLTADKDLQRAYPQLNAEGRTHLMQAIQEYLIQKRFVQHLERVQGKVADILAGIHAHTLTKAAKKLMIQELGKTMSQAPTFAYTDPLAKVYLILETTLNIKLRTEQVDTIVKFYNSIHDGQDVAVQMIMGSGKTSIIQPILSFLLAKKGTLSAVYVPASLYETVKSSLEKSLGNAFKQFVFADPFTKELSSNIAYLKTYLSLLQEAKERQAVVLLKPQHKYALYSALKDAYAQNQPHRCNLLADICRECAQSEMAQMDEIDLCLDPTVVYKFPIGKSRMIDPQKAKIVTELVLELTQDETLCRTVSIDFIDAYHLRQNPSYKAQGKAISAELFESEVKPLLIQKAEQLLARHIPNYLKIKSLDTQNYIAHFLHISTPYDQDLRKQCTPENEYRLREVLESHQLEGLSKNDISTLELINNKLLFQKERNAWIEKQFGAQKQLVAICTKTINAILQQSLLKECGSNYYHDPELETKGIFTARPYFAPNSPKSSVPSDSYELAIYSMQNLLFNGVPAKAAEKVLTQWRKEALLFEHNITASPSYREYIRLLGADAQRFRLTDDPPPKELIDILQKKLSKDPKALLDFMDKHVFPQIVDFEKSISTPPLAGLTGFNKQRIGYTGTVNPGILPKNMQVHREKGTEGKILLVINNKLEKDACHIYQYTKEQQEYAEQVIHQFKTQTDLYTFIDSGNWLKDVQFKPWLEKLGRAVSASRPGIQGVVYPDEKGAWFSLEKDPYANTWTSISLEMSTLRPNQRLTIIPSKHETGTDIKQPPTARALNSIRKGMTLRDALQSIFRMRELFAGQKVDFALSKEVSEHIDPQQTMEISAKSLGAYLLINQIEDNFTKNQLATLHRFYEILEAPVRKRLMDTLLPYDERKKLFDVLQNIFVATKTDDPFLEMCQEKRMVPQEKAMSYHIENIVKGLDFKNPLVIDLFQSPEALTQKLLDGVDVTSLPKMLTIGGGSQEANEIEIEIDIEKEQQQQQEQQIELERDIEIHAVNPHLIAHEYKPLAAQVKKTSEYMLHELFALKPNAIETLLPDAVKPLFQQEEYTLEFSQNLFPTKSLASEYHLPGRYLLLLKNPGQKDRILLISHQDADLIKRGLRNKQTYMKSLAPHQALALISLEGKLSDCIPENTPLNLTAPPLQQAIVQAKLLTGKVRFTESELRLLEEKLLKSQGPQHIKAAVALCKLYQSILAHLPDSAKLYSLSSIKPIFQKYDKFMGAEIANLYILGKDYIESPDNNDEKLKYIQALEIMMQGQPFNREYYLNWPNHMLASTLQVFQAANLKAACLANLGCQLAYFSVYCPHLSQTEQGVLKLLSLCCIDQAAGKTNLFQEIFSSFHTLQGLHYDVIQELLRKVEHTMRIHSGTLNTFTLLMNPAVTEEYLQSTKILERLSAALNQAAKI